MKRFGALFMLCALSLPVFGGKLYAAQAATEENALVPPISALLTPNGARLNVVQKAHVKIANNAPTVAFVLPANAGNLQMSIPGQTIARWSSTPVLLNDATPFAGRRTAIEKEKIDVSAKLMTVNSRLKLWQEAPKNSTAQEMEQMQLAMRENMPELVQEQAELQQRLRLIDEELSRMPNPSDLGERVSVTLAGDVKEDAEVTINYSYNHDGCGWQPVYDFNARPEEGEGVIDVRMLAEIWQYTGINWPDTEITLATRGFGPREPAPLPKWIIDSAQPQPAPQPRNAADRPATMALKAEKADTAPAMAPVAADTDAVYASWNLSQHGLSQGRSRLEISSTVFKTPLQWLARPSAHSTEVWLMARYELPKDHAWPAGIADYSVNGQNTGSGDFAPRGNEAVLYFGPDPRVTILTTTDSRQRSISGIINSNRSWSASWTYTIVNQHNQPVQVRVERPAPQVVDKSVTVTYKNEPRAVTEQNMLVWTVDVPAHGKSTIDHSVTITSPNKLPLLPDVP